MCGIAGIVSADPGGISAERLKRMTDAIAHRGPDGEGHWKTDKVGLGSRRLSVIDLSAEGNQPMRDSSGRYTLVFNGEIYNYIELKGVLRERGYRFRSGTDTEVLLAMYDWKKEACLDDIDGMFAFAIYDALQKQLFCARDRFGEKPFYYACEPGRYFIFGSEMKALWAAGLPKDVDTHMLYNYLAFGLVENPNDRTMTFYRGIHRLENSHFVALDVDTIRPVKRKYWDIDLSRREDAEPETKVLEKFSELMTRSVNRRLRSDVPVGSSLSGGIDSSAIVSLASELLADAGKQIRTFSARFPGFAKDEGVFIESVVAKTRAEPVYVYPSGQDLVAKINEIYHFQEEPFGSASVIAQYEVMQAAREHGVTVLLDGQGADEILGGYRHYYPPYIRGLGFGRWRESLDAVRHYLSMDKAENGRFRLIKDAGRIISSDFPGLVHHFKRGRIRFKQTVNPVFDPSFYEENHRYVHLPSKLWGERDLDHCLYFDTYVSGLSELLRYADRNAMAHSREVRLPFLDHQLVTFLFGLPEAFKIRGGRTKYLLRKAFDPYLPTEVVWRKEKIGYEPPQAGWMANKDVIESIREAKVQLVKRGIAHKGFLGKDSVAHPTHERRLSDWCFLMAAGLFR
jgi:asparagine synthase (glutamine-hydrolysing)